MTQRTNAELRAYAQAHLADYALVTSEERAAYIKHGHATAFGSKAETIYEGMVARGLLAVSHDRDNWKYYELLPLGKRAFANFVVTPEEVLALVGIEPVESASFVRIEGDEIVIRITKDGLVQGTKYLLAEWIEKLGRQRKVKVTDPALWMREVANALNEENTDGDSKINLMLDWAAKHAFEQGGEGVFVEGVHDKPKPRKRRQRSI